MAETANEAALRAQIQELQEALEKARTEAQENWDQKLRALAEVENLKKRSAREVEEARKYALREFIEALLPVKDNLEKALAAARTRNAHVNVGALLEGTEMTLRLFGEVLKAHGVTELDPLGERFDPEHHEAVEMRAAPGAHAGTVVAVHQKGYLLNGRLIRPARVAVAAPAAQAGGR